MSDPDLAVIEPAARRAWLRLRTLMLLRWLAVLGQSAAVLVASVGLGLELRIDACVLVIGASVLFNVVAAGVGSENRRLTETEAILTLLFDVGQLSALLYFTGGLSNPFALLMLAPVTISASVLSLRATVLLAAVAALMITGLLLEHRPLRLAGGELLSLAPLLAVGTWASLIIGIVFLAVYARRVTEESFSMSRALVATQMALVREQQMAALGGVVAAAAHELGTPLATIKLVSTELVDELAGRPDLREDAELIRNQADRCRDILRAMGPSDGDDAHLRFAPFASVVEEAAAPHVERGIRIVTRIGEGAVGQAPARHPEVARKPEIIQGLRNLVQNAVDFARATVWIDLDWNDTELRVAIGDDGPGYPPDLIKRIGDPFVRRREAPGPERPGYEGMGLGLFIAKTLLERTGARLSFANGGRRPDAAGPVEAARPTGAVVVCTWPRERVTRAPEPLRERRGPSAAIHG